MDLGLGNKSVVVTGAGSNIGRAISLVFGHCGSKVAILDLDDDAAKEVAQELSSSDDCPAALGLGTDVTDSKQVEGALAQIVAAHGGIDIWINNAGWVRDRMFLEQPREEMEKTLSVNLWGNINCVQAVLPKMVEQGHGSIVTIASDAGRVGEYKEAVYSACKAGVIAFSKALAREYGPKGIRMNVICPGMTLPGDDDKMSAFSMHAHGSGMPQELRERIAKKYPLRRLGTAKDTALAAVFLASDAASFITGQTLSVSGGYSMIGVGEVNQSSYEWAVENLPLFESSDDDLNQAYYYRAKSYKSHLVPTDWVDIKYVSSEFGPTVSWGGVYGTINAAAGHHLSEGRWIRDRSYMDGLARFWIGSQGNPTSSGNTSSGAFEPVQGHFANGTRGTFGACAYSSWILTGALKAAAVKGDFTLGKDMYGNPVTYADVLPEMVEWWEGRSLQLRPDCVLANNGSTRTDGDKRCLDEIINASWPFCYEIADGWDAMEGSVSGNGCRPTVGAMMISEALAVATVANATGNATLGAKFTRRAEMVRDWYLEHLWNEESQFLGVYKEGLCYHGMGGCSVNGAPMNKSDTMCCCVEPGQNVGHYANFSVCTPRPPRSPGNKTQCLMQQNTGPPERSFSNWPCGKPVSVRELLGLGPAYYFGIVPESKSGATKYDGMWQALFDEKAGFWGKYGPTTVERRSTCFNKSQDMEMCNWAGPSWPYETSRVLTGLSRFLIDYPSEQSSAAGMTSEHYTKLLRTYARSMTTGSAWNGSTPWVGEDIEPDKGFWIARSVLYRGQRIDPDMPWVPAKDNPYVQPVNCSACKGSCWDRGWSPDGQKCTAMKNVTLSKMLGPCELGCSCVPPDASYDYTTHSSPKCCSWKPTSCDGQKLPPRDKDRGKDYNHSTFLDLIIEGLIGLRAALSSPFPFPQVALIAIPVPPLDEES
eukprot:g1573.t1